MEPEINNPLCEYAGCCASQPPDGEWRDIFEDPVRPRRNGYEWPPDPLQVISWLFIISMTVVHFTAQTPYLPLTLLIIDYAISGVAILVVVLVKIALELLSQADPVVFNSKPPRMTYNEMFDTPVPKGMQTCYFCRRFVDQSSKHCSVCDKCVPGFDHHCRWLNSCIGERNYGLFIAFVIAAWVGMAWVFAISLYLIIWALHDVDAFKNHMETHTYRTRRSLFPLIMVLGFIVLLCMLVGLIMMSKLILFHISLRCRNMTTYDHILMKRERRRQLQAQMHLPNDNAEEPGEATGATQQLPLGTSCSVKTCAFSNLCSERRRRDFKKYKGMQLPVPRNNGTSCPDNEIAAMEAQLPSSPLQQEQQQQQQQQKDQLSQAANSGRAGGNTALTDIQPSMSWKMETIPRVTRNDSSTPQRKNFSPITSTAAMASQSLISVSIPRQPLASNDSYLASPKESGVTTNCNSNMTGTSLVEASGGAANERTSRSEAASRRRTRRSVHSDPRRQVPDVPSFDFNEPVLDTNEILRDIKL